MQRTQKIASYFLLSLFSMFLLHQVLPHSHHQHELTEVKEAHKHHHSHPHSHDHHNKEKKDSNDPFDLLGFLLGNHAHFYHSHDLQVRNKVTPQIQIQVLSPHVLPEIQLFSFEYYNGKVVPVPRYKPGYCDPYLFTHSLRGPPALG